MINLKTSSEALQVITSGAYNLDWVVFYREYRGGTVLYEFDSGQITTATTTTIFTDGSVSATNFYEIYEVHLKNRDATNSNTVTLLMDDGADDRHFTPAVTLAAGETLSYVNGLVQIITSSGTVKTPDTSTKKMLGQAAPSATTETTLYTVPAGKTARAGLLMACNRGAASATFRVSISVGGGATANKDYIYYDLTIAAYDSFLLDSLLGLNLSATDVVRVYASTGDLSFNLNGEEF